MEAWGLMNENCFFFQSFSHCHFLLEALVISGHPISVMGRSMKKMMRAMMASDSSRSRSRSHGRGHSSTARNSVEGGDDDFDAFDSSKLEEHCLDRRKHRCLQACRRDQAMFCVCVSCVVPILGADILIYMIFLKMNRFNLAIPL